MSIPDSTAYSLWSNYFKPVQETCTAQGDKQNLGLHTILIPAYSNMDLSPNILCDYSILFLRRNAQQSADWVEKGARKIPGSLPHVKHILTRDCQHV